MNAISRQGLLAMAIVAAVGAATMLAQVVDAWAGVWTLNLAQSTYELGPAPQRAISRLERSGDVWNLSQDTVDAEGHAVHVEARVRFDGQDYPVAGAPNTTWAFTRIDDHTYRLVAKRNGAITATANTVVSADGKTRTTTTSATNVQGQTLKNVAVYQRSSK